MIVSSACFSDWLHEGDILVDALGGGRVRARPTTRTGSCMNCVAELARSRSASSPRRTASGASSGSMRTIASSAWMKPRSIIWSASSSTKISTSRSVRRAGRSGRAGGPGVATRMSTPRPVRRSACRRAAAEHGGHRHLAELAIAAAVVGDLGGELARRREHQHAARVRQDALRIAARRWIEGSENAAVLPVPVCAMPSRSRPSSSGGIAWRWIGVGVGIALGFERAEQRLGQAEVGK